MKYNSCEFIQGGLRFYVDSVDACCSIKQGPVFIENFHGKNLNFEEINKKRMQIIEDCKNNIIPSGCEKCINLQNSDWGEFDGKIKQIFLLHWYHCNSSCIYCINQAYTKGKVTKKPKDSDYYNVYPLLKEAVDKGYVSKDLTLHCLGGESAVLKEMDKILKLFIEHGLKFVYLVTSGIDYIKSMKEVFQKYDGQIVISLDAGNRETYCMIKRVDKFYSVVDNIKQYIEDTNGDLDKILVKYILTEGYNDTEEEIDDFFKVISSLGLTQTRLDVDYRDTCEGKCGKLPEHFLALNKYFREKAKSLNIKLNQYDVMEKIFEQGTY